MGALGPSVRIDLGEVLPANQPVTLRIRWSGALVSPEGGPLATKRLAYVGTGRLLLDVCVALVSFSRLRG